LFSFYYLKAEYMKCRLRIVPMSFHSAYSDTVI